MTRPTGMTTYVLKRADGLLFAGYPARFTDDVNQARHFWSARGARTAASHLTKRLAKRGQLDVLFARPYVFELCEVLPEGGAQ